MNAEPAVGKLPPNPLSDALSDGGDLWVSIVNPISNWLVPGHDKFCSDNANNKVFDDAAAAAAAGIAWKTKTWWWAGTAITLKGSATVESLIDRGYCK